MTANGEVDAPLIRIQSLTVGGQVVSPITVGAISFSRSAASFDGLLGMNFLQKFEFSLDQQRSVLELHFRRDGGRSVIVLHRHHLTKKMNVHFLTPFSLNNGVSK